MIRPLSLRELQVRFGGEVHGDREAAFSQVSTDSRAVSRGDLFVALVGDKYDGHDFVNAVQSSAPAASVVTQSWAKENLVDSSMGSFWCVENTDKALAQIATLVREDFTGPLIAITGSCGKTSVKEMLVAIASNAFEAGDVLATQGNFNNHIGVPKTLFELLPQHQFAIVEMGASGPNEIAYLTAIARPSVAVVNNVMAAHVEGFGSIDGVAKTKSAIYQGLTEGGIAIINLDDDYAGMFQVLNASRRQVSVSLNSNDADVTASDIKLEAEQSSFSIRIEGNSYPVSLSVAGLHSVRNALVAAACAFASGLPIADIVQGLNQFTGVKGRMNISKPSPKLTLIDDSYNANPGSVKAAIDALTAFEGQRWLVLGDMGELGLDEAHHHQLVGNYAKEVRLDGMVAVGKLSQYSASAFGSSHVFATHQGAVTFLKDLIDSQAGHITILIKGSRSARMELIAQAITDLMRIN